MSDNIKVNVQYEVEPGELAKEGYDHFDLAMQAMWYVFNADNLPVQTRLDYAKCWRAQCNNELLDVNRKIRELDYEAKEQQQ
jgi:hypothetical protein